MENSDINLEVKSVNMNSGNIITIVEDNDVEILEGNFCLVSSVHFDSAEISEAQTIFKSWGLKDETCAVLKEYGYNSIACIESMSNEDINEIFSKLDKSFFGQRSIIKQKLGELKKERVSKILDYKIEHIGNT